MEDAIKQGNKTSINNQTHIVGNIRAEEDLIVNGKFKGDVEIREHSFFLGPSGRLIGNIYGQNVRIRGQMHGEIVATGKVEITREAKFSGKITGKSVTVEKGAHFDADVKLGQESPGNKTWNEKSSEKPTT